MTRLPNTSNGGANIDNEDIRCLEAGIENADIENCNTAIDHILHKLVATPGIRLPDIQLQCLNIFMAGIRKVGPMPIQINEQLGKSLLPLEGISRFRTLDQLKQWLLQVIQSIIELKTLHNIPAKNDLISDVKEYISQNFGQNLSLAVLANRFFINPFYLSQLFKEKAGETYLNYVMKVRINKAKELLKTTHLKIAEVCESVGYTDTKYFSKLFEKLTGCKPSEYKSMTKSN
jgi:two-component system response regulator YesN